MEEERVAKAAAIEVRIVGIARAARVVTGAGIVIVAKIARIVVIARGARAEYVAVEEVRVVAINQRK
jgi:hypothetical protein